MAHLRLTARTRVEPLSDRETVRLGRLLHRQLGVAHVAFPDDVSAPAVVLRDFAGPLPEALQQEVRAILGEFDADVVAAP